MARGCKRVSRANAVRKSGKKKGKLKEGCRYIKGDGAMCCPPGSKKSSSKKSRGRKKSSKKRRSSKRKGKRPNTPQMDSLNAVRRAWKSASTCREKREALRALKKRFTFMARQPARQRRGESQGAAASRRWSRWKSEYRNKLEATEYSCSGRRTRAVGPVMVNGLSAAQKKKHPCARMNPPAWCNKK